MVLQSHLLINSFIILPDDLLEKILGFLLMEDFKSCVKVCSRWHKIVNLLVVKKTYEWRYSLIEEKRNNEKNLFKELLKEEKDQMLCIKCNLRQRCIIFMPCTLFFIHKN